jgi:hypothetical protein
MPNDIVLSRRLVLGRVAAIAVAGFAVPNILTASKSFAEDKGSESKDSTSEPAEGTETENETETGSDDGAGAVIAPSAAALSPTSRTVALKKKHKKK